MPNIAKLLLIVTFCATMVNGDLFSSIEKLKPLVSTEEELLDLVQEYLRLERQRLLNIERLVEEIKQERINPSSAAPSAASSGGIDLGNPIQSYLLLRRLRRQWRDVARYVADTTNQLTYSAKFRELSSSVWKYPLKQDLTESVRALLRLQEVYQLNTSDLAGGRLLGQQNSAPLLASDCYDIGLEAWLYDRFFYSSRMVAEWMLEALRKLGKEKKHDVSPEKDNLRSQAEILITAQHLTSLLLTENVELSITNVGNAINITHQILTKDSAIEIPAPNLQRPSNVPQMHYTNSYRYFALCRGDESSYNKPNNPRSLVCRYNHYNRPGLLIRPAKEEILATEPPVVYYHDMLTDHEIKLLKERALPLLKQSTTGLTYWGEKKPEVDNVNRVSNIAWLWDIFDSKDELGKILPRLEDYSNLEMSYNATEPIQVANYGLGGHYHPHYDDNTEGVSEGLRGMGKRIATALYYLSDVEAGGATVFVKAGIRVPPVKGSAVFWYNYLKNGDRDLQTLHAGCPVLMGSKWACNLWIRERAQTFRRKCGLTRNDIY